MKCEKHQDTTKTKRKNNSFSFLSGLVDKANPTVYNTNVVITTRKE